MLQKQIKKLFQIQNNTQKQIKNSFKKNQEIISN
jgi:hypothetical protein